MLNRSLGALITVCLTTAIAFGPRSATAQTYSLVDLGSLGTVTGPGAESTGYALNSNGEVVGDSATTPIAGATPTHAFKYSNGQMLDLGVLPGSLNSYGRGINDSGQVVGFSGDDPSGCCHDHAFLYSNGTMTDIGTLGGADSFAYGINATGQITGSSDTPGSNSGQQHAFVYSNGVMTDLNAALGGQLSQGTAINDSGSIAGSVYSSGWFAFLYANGVVSTVGTLGGASSYGYAINSLDVIAGGNTLNSGDAFTYSNGVTTDLGALPGAAGSEALGINAIAEVVGMSATPESSPTSPYSAAFVYRNGVMTDLNSLINPADPLQSVVHLTDARAVNDKGWILANGTNNWSNPYHSHAFLLEPTWLTVTPATLSFGNQKIGTASASKAVVVTNTGTASVGVSLAISGNFVQTNNCDVSLAAGAMCTVQVGFVPSGPDTLSGALTVTPAGTAPLVASLTGAGQASLSMSTSASSVTAGVAVTLTWVASPAAACTALGGSTADGWIGPVPASGSKPVTETSAGTYTYRLTCVDGSQSLPAQEIVTVTVPTATISAAPTNLTHGQATMLTWTSKNASSCSASSNGTDSWSGAQAPSGTASVMESATGLITYRITCTSGPQSVSASTQVFFAAPPSNDGGGGSLDLVSVLLLISAAVCRPAPRPAR